MKTYAVTGANGFLGSACCELLRRGGHSVKAFIRRPAAAEDVEFHLGRDVDPKDLDGVDVLIHAAHEFAAGASERNVLGSKRLFEAARAATVPRLVFVSSVSAHASCQSRYGRDKLEVEEAVRRSGGLSVRPGLLWGRPGKGMFGSLSRMSKLPVLPVFDGGDQPLVLAHVDDAASAVATVGDAPLPEGGRPVIAAHPRVWPLVDLLRQLAKNRGNAVRTVSIPSALALRIMRAAERAGVPLPFRSDSLLGLLNPDRALDFWATDVMHLSFRDFLVERGSGASA